MCPPFVPLTSVGHTSVQAVFYFWFLTQSPLGRERCIWEEAQVSPQCLFAPLACLPQANQWPTLIIVEATLMAASSTLTSSW